MTFQRCPLLFVILFCLSTTSLVAQPKKAEPDYPLSADSKPQEGVPRGEVLGPFTWKSKIYPGTTREYGIYVPAQYDKSKPACLMVIQDGMGRARGWKLPTVMDNLIHKGDMPVTIGLFIGHGQVPAANKNAQPRFNRSFEYDALGDRYARFLLEEILPEVKKTYNISDDPNDRAIGGASSGAICAFTVAWERPDQFRRVLSTIGTYVGLRGGDVYPTLIRKTEPKPLRIFLQDGSNDLSLYGGDWWMANQTMYRALEWSGYEVKHVFGEGGHNGKHSTAIMPDAMRWLWKDHGEPITAGIGKGAKRRTDLLIPGEEWQLVSSGHKFTEGPAINDKGELFFTDIPNNTIHKVDASGSVSVFQEKTGGANGLAFGANGWLYACQGRAKRIVRYAPDGTMEVLFENAPSNDIVKLRTGGYYTDPNNNKLWHFDDEGNRRVVDTGIAFPNGVMLSPDQTLLTVSDTHGRFTHSFQVQADGSLAHKQIYGHLHVPDETSQSGADGMTVDSEGRLYVTTKVGLQVLDQLGRVHLIINKPKRGWLSNAVFGGPQLNTLYITIGDSVYRRRIKATGLRQTVEPIKPPKPNL